jgi:hypothetical protein
MRGRRGQLVQGVNPDIRGREVEATCHLVGGRNRVKAGSLADRISVGRVLDRDRLVLSDVELLSAAR